MWKMSQIQTFNKNLNGVKSGTSGIDWAYSRGQSITKSESESKSFPRVRESEDPGFWFKNKRVLVQIK